MPPRPLGGANGLIEILGGLLPRIGVIVFGSKLIFGNGLRIS